MSNPPPSARRYAALGAACLALASCGTAQPTASPDAAADAPPADVEARDVAAEPGIDAPAPDVLPPDAPAPDAMADVSPDAPDVVDAPAAPDAPDANDATAMNDAADERDVTDAGAVADTADASASEDAGDAADASASMDIGDAADASAAIDGSALADAVDAADTGADVAAELTCGAGLTLCGGRCVTTATDRAHCGGCGNACPAGNSCVAGACVVDRCLDVTCAPADACHAPNTCDRATGLCAGDPLRVTVSAAAASAFTGASGCSPGATGAACLFRPYDVAGNFAAQANNGGRAAVTSGTVPGFATIHSPGGVNDGRYGNGASWVASTPTSWLKIDLGRTVAIDRITFGRDRVSGTEDARQPGRYTVRVASTEVAYAEGDASFDEVEYRRVFDSSVVGGRGEASLRGDTLEARFPPVVGRYVKIEFVSPAAGVALDEVQVYGCDPGTTTCPALPRNEGSMCDDGLRTTSDDRCALGACVGAACTPGFADCDRDAANACETDITTRRNCGGCGVACAAGQQCAAGRCVVGDQVAVAFVPGPGRLEVYTPQASTVRVRLGSTALPPLVFAGPGVQSVALAASDALLLEGDEPFVAWVHDNANTDQAEAASAVNGSPLATELYTWAGSTVTVLAGATPPRAVRLFDVSAATPTEVAAWASPAAGAFRALRVPRPAVYRVVAEGAPVTAFGQSLTETYNHTAFVPADNGSFRGTSFRYAEPVGAGGVRRIVAQSLAANTGVTFRVGAVDTPRTLTAAFSTTSLVFPADTLAAVTSSEPVLAWIEADPGEGTCDGSVADADLVPSVRGAFVDTLFRLRPTVAAAECAPTRRADFDVLSYSRGTFLLFYEGASTTPFNGTSLDRGQRFRIVTDAAAGRDIRVEADPPATVQRSHAPFDFLLRVASTVSSG
ncbi:MAG: hypothetical protein U0324_25120 [Polyangiales bacterium]